MRVRPGGARPRAGAGFTLIELILAISLMVLLGGMVWLNYVTIGQRGKVDEAVARVASTLNLCRAEAGATGKSLRLEFVGDGQMKVTIEAQPLTDPGVFVDYQAGPWSDDPLSDQLKVNSCRLLAPGIDSVMAQSSDGPAMPPIGFYPDGSGDSATIELSPRNGDDTRTFIIDFDGLNGTTMQRILLPSELEEYRRQNGQE